MSARLLKQFLKEQEQKQRQERREIGDGSEEEEDAESPDFGSRSSINPFDFLNEEDDDEPDQDESKATEETFIRSSDEVKREMTAVEGTSTSNCKPKKKNKSKKKKKGKEGPTSANKVEESLEEVLENLSLDVNYSVSGPDPTKSNLGKAKVNDKFVKRFDQSILQVNPKNLNPQNELRKIFGSKVVKSFEQSNQAGGSRQLRGGRSGARHRKTNLVTPLEHWPQWDGSFSMELLETKDGCNYFRYVYSASYDETQRLFEGAKATHDLNGVAVLLRHRHRYHIDSLMALAYYHMLTGEHQTSADETAMCLYALECAWHPMFTPFQGNCQLKYSHETNKALFKVLFTHMKSLDRQGCCRSALEVCKLLLSLDSDDPMGALFCIDYFALRAEEYAWLEQFSEEYKSDNSLWMFPNFSFSLAICRFNLEKEGTLGDSSVGVAKSRSVDLMKQALMLHPSVLRKLEAKVPLKSQIWTTILKNTFFQADRTGSLSLDHLIDLYIERSYIIWKRPELQKFLQDAAAQVIEALEHNINEAKDWACVSKEAFSSESNEYVHLLVSDFSDKMPSLTPENLENAMVDLRIVAGQNGVQVDNQQNGGPAPQPIANRNALAVLMESILPWVHYEDGEGGVADEDDGHGAGHD
ncbi:hypothetical protein HS088_TW17G00948 [Tripterygium wilfordii]|uniref:Transcription factor 25 n=1 Tax=Tripterygium wilfordii TaxID=458696 RepID=A0A7J7CH82_TRIWF|nr:transcription factor 25 isoform X2 [Tripterygium wilfordii]KAF5733405.1 hypothetical protein HS088_TW17G00948 [Tripterygium wilfordii]